MTLTNKIISGAISLAFLMPFAAPVFAQEVPTAPVNVACIKAAVAARELAIDKTLDAYQATVRAARIVRKDAELAAWDLPDRRARKTADRERRQRGRRS